LNREIKACEKKKEGEEWQIVAVIGLNIAELTKARDAARGKLSVLLWQQRL
jgi:hypothetical protein